MAKKLKERRRISLDERSMRLARADGRKLTDSLIAAIHEKLSDTGSRGIFNAVESGSYKIAVIDAIEKGAVVLSNCIAKGFAEKVKDPEDLSWVLDSLSKLIECEASSFFEEYEPEHPYIKNQLLKYFEWPKWEPRDRITVLDRAVSNSTDWFSKEYRKSTPRAPLNDRLACAEKFIKEQNRKGIRPTGEAIADAIRDHLGGCTSANSVSKEITPKLKERGLVTGNRAGHYFPEELPAQSK